MPNIIKPHEAQDRLLKFIIDKTKTLSSNQFITSHSIAQAVFPGEPKEWIYVLIDRMLDVEPPLFNTYVESRAIQHFNVKIRSTAIAETYLEEGGFTRKYNAIEAQKAKRDRIEQQEEEIRIDNLKLNKLNKRFLFINAILAVFTLLWTIIWSILNSK